VGWGKSQGSSEGWWRRRRRETRVREREGEREREWERERECQGVRREEGAELVGE
jgi:hypothetical protein